MRSIIGELARYEIKRSMSFDVGHIGVLNASQGGGGIDISPTDPMTSYATQGSFNAVYDPQPAHSSTNGGDLTNDRINHIAKLDGTGYQVGRALASPVSDTAWVLRDHFRITANTKNGSGYAICPIVGLCSEGSTFDEDDGNMDSLSFAPYSDNLTRPYKIGYSDGSSQWSESHPNFSETATVNDEFYKEHTRLSSTSHKIELFSDAYSTSSESKTQTIPSTVQDLDNYVIRNINPDHSQSGSMTTWWDDIGLQDGVTSWV